ncbi:SDR family NAD(P)-dependent oxidoreductase [Kribbella jiaozuonensis]|uniref:SDR family NAD(P)-dependent oxidoreductase n=1 Tax=Kribbella jiaozuonensis TaxID=2575441 RepID=A0A4U3LJ26_9ACTN|nr:SDR family NAD(P)-dependent oxidoreductase [Kribbella jiaozuonensis]
MLVNNAGIALPEGRPSEVPVDVLRRVYDTNVFGLVAVTQAALPLLRRAEAGRIVKVVVRYSTLPADGPSGGFYDENGPIRW